MGDRATRIKTFSVASLSNINPTRTGLEMNLSLYLISIMSELIDVFVLLRVISHDYVVTTMTPLLTLRRLMSYIYIYGAPILDVSRSHTTTQHSR